MSRYQLAAWALAIAPWLIEGGCAEQGSRSTYARPVSAVPPGAQLREMLALYDEACLRAFPDDGALARAMAARHARQMSAAEVPIYLRDDPGTGWTVTGRTGIFRVTLEAPPFHACGVRTMTRSGFPDLAPYRALVGPFERAPGVFKPVAPIDTTVDGLRTTGGGESSAAPDGGQQALLVFVATPSDAEARRHGETAIEVRFVHQIVVPAQRPTV